MAASAVRDMGWDAAHSCAYDSACRAWYISAASSRSSAVMYRVRVTAPATTAPPVARGDTSYHPMELRQPAQNARFRAPALFTEITRRPYSRPTLRIRYLSGTPSGTLDVNLMAIFGWERDGEV